MILSNGAAVEKIKYTLLIPLHYNDGTPVAESELDQIYDEIYVLGNGVTHAAIVHGAYRMKDGAKKIDRSAEVWVAIEPGQESELKRLAAAICRRLKQESIYLEKSEATIEFIPPANGD
jgi:hypothetical protein